MANSPLPHGRGTETPPPAPPATSPRGSRLALGIVAVVIAACAAAAAFVLGRADLSSGHDRLLVRPTPSVVLAMRDLSRLESATFHMEKIVELTDEQERLFGLVHARDEILLVAVGDVVAGVDMSRLADGDVQLDSDAGSVRVVLPSPEVLSTAIDEKQTHVYGRSTDLLATRKEQLEGLARQEAAAQIEKGARDGGILDRARASAERTVRALLQSLGYQRVFIDWKA